MIEINLLPEQYRKKKSNFSVKVNLGKYKTYIEKFIAAPIGILVLAVIMLVVYPGLQSKTLKRLDVRWKNVEKDYAEIDKLKSGQKRLQGLTDSISRITKDRIVWSEILNIVSDSLPPEIQLTELNSSTEEIKDKPGMSALIISGIVPLYPGEKAIGDFIKALNENKDFVKVFHNIEPPSTESTPEGLKRFTFKCYILKAEKKSQAEPIKKKK